MIRHLDPALSIGFKGDSLAVQISSCMSVPQQKLLSRIARPTVYVILSFSDVPFRLMTLILRTPPHITQRNASARERQKPIMKRPTASSSRPPNSTVAQQSSGAAQTQSSSQANAAVSSPTAPPVIANTTSNASLRAIINCPTRWTCFWLFVCQSLTLSGILNLQGEARKQARHV
jgi:hypothetical protein